MGLGAGVEVAGGNREVGNETDVVTTAAVGSGFDEDGGVLEEGWEGGCGTAEAFSIVELVGCVSSEEGRSSSGDGLSTL